MVLLLGDSASEPEALRARLDAAVSGRALPAAVVDLDALEANASDLLRRARDRPVRLATKSIRSRGVLERVRALDPRFHRVMAYTLAEALWLAGSGCDDVLVAYPTADTAALRRLAGDEALRSRVTVMVDSRDHLDLLGEAPIRVCIELDAGFPVLGGRTVIGARRSPLRTAGAVVALAREVVRRGHVLDGLMAYEAQIAGVADRPAGAPLRGAAMRELQRRSARELAERRAAVVARVREVADLRFVNGGGTGSLERTAAEPAVTEVAAGSGLYGPALFDGYSSFRPRPAAAFALPAVRRPSRGVVTVLGGGWIASGAAGRDRLPVPWLPAGLTLDRREGAGEVQTPLHGDAADRLRVGDAVWFRHAKAGELCEHVNELLLVRGDEVVDAVATYRGEGFAFL